MEIGLGKTEGRTAMNENGPLLLTKSGLVAPMAVERHAAPSAVSCLGKTGWARFVKGVVLTEFSSQTQDLGALLSAEWIEADGQSCRIIADPLHPGQLVKLRFPDPDQKFEVERVEVQGHGAAKGKTLLYDIYWTDDGEGAVRRALDLFRGFGAEKGKRA